MPSVTLHPPSLGPTHSPASPLPPLLRTPHGLAIIEIQGRLNIAENEDRIDEENVEGSAVDIGRIEFPLLTSSADSIDPSVTASMRGAEEGPWGKQVHLYIGQNQRLVGEVKRLKKPLAVIRRKAHNPVSTSVGLDMDKTVDTMDLDTQHVSLAPSRDDDLEIVDIIKWKLFFGGRPEFV